MSEVKKGNENVKCGKKLLNGTKCLGEVFVYPCAACLSQSITTKDKKPQEGWMSSVRRMEWSASLTASGNSMLALNCQFMVFAAICLLSKENSGIEIQCDLQPSNRKTMHVFLSNDRTMIIGIFRGDHSMGRDIHFRVWVCPHFSLKAVMREKRMTGSGWPKWPWSRNMG